MARENAGVSVAAHSGEGAGCAGTSAPGEKIRTIVKMEADQCQHQMEAVGMGRK